MTTYQLTDGASVIKDGTITIATNPDPFTGTFNPDAEEFFAWKDAGGVPIPYVPNIPVPTAITMRQARLELLSRGMLATVNSQVASMSEEAKIEWEYSNEVHRDNPLISSIATMLSLDSAAIDELFIAASLK